MAEFIVAIELGSTKITGIAGKKNLDGSITVLAVVREDSTQCIRKGVVYNIDKTVQCLSNIITKLKTALRTDIAHVYVGVGGQSIRSVRNVIVKEVPEDTVVSQEMVNQLMDANRMMSYPDREILEAATQEYKLDQQYQLDPVGIQCNRLEGNFLNILWHKTFYRNLNNVNARYVHDLEAYRWAKNEISRLEKRIADYQDDRKAPEKWNIENEMLATDCVITLHRLASRGRQAPENSRQELYQLVANHDPSLMKTLHQSHLNEKERLVCPLIRLRFIPSELSVLLGISPQNVTNMRQRLLQKLFHAQGGAKDFDERIRSL